MEVNKDDLYGKLDPTTLDWNDGIFKDTLRKILDSQRGENSKRRWNKRTENRYKILDDNKLFTLPHSYRLSIPPNVRIMFEVENFKYATLHFRQYLDVVSYGSQRI